MLKGISPLLSPELLKTIAAMGHGDELVFGDCNFPSETMGKRVVRADGLRATELLDAVLALFPLDTAVEKPVIMMQADPVRFKDGVPIEKEFRAIVEKHEPGKQFDFIERFAFYERAKNAYAVVATGEQAIYACIIIKKGVLITK